MRINDENELDLCDSIITIIYEKETVTEIISGMEFKKPVFGVAVIYHDGRYDEPITLATIRNKFPKPHLVISERGLSGKIYRYGNHGEYWEEVGKTEGYA